MVKHKRHSILRCWPRLPELYRVNDATRFGNTVRLVVFDEAFNKMDSDRITESVLLLRKMGLQAIICTPPDKVSDIMPIADRTLLVDKSGYRMHIIPFGKEMQNEGSTGDPEVVCWISLKTVSIFLNPTHPDVG